MKITVFGARGAIGRLVTAEALARGWDVTACARDTTGLPAADRLTLVRAELTDGPAIAQALSGARAALTCFGPSFTKRNDDVRPLTAGVRLIAAKTAEADVKRLIVLATPSMRSPEDEPVFKVRFLVRLVRLLIPDAYREINGMGRETMRPGLDWTIVRQLLPNDRVPTGVVCSGGVNRQTEFAVSRVDVARFMVDQVEDRTFIKRMPVIWSGR
jgi:hypothetical protein